jgi:P27 family predicted phage terminase small subunit
MGRRGPMKKSMALKVLNGSEPLTKEKVEDLQEQFIPPEIPKHFNKREIETWNKTIELLRFNLTLRKVDGSVLGAYCSAFVRWQDTEKEIQKSKSIKDGLCILDDNGKPKSINPLVIISRDAQRDMVFYAAQLGMTPASRIKMVAGVSKIIEQNPFIKIKAMKK